MQTSETPRGPTSTTPHPQMMNIMANGHQLQIDLEKVKGQLLDILKDHPTYASNQMTPTGSGCPGNKSRGRPSLGMSGVRLQNQYNQKMRVRRTPSCRECGSPYKVTPRSHQGQGESPCPPPVSTRRRSMLYPVSDNMVTSAVHSTVASHAFPSCTPETAAPRRVPKRRQSPMSNNSNTRREYLRAKRARHSSSIQILEAPSPSQALSESVSLSQDDIDPSTDVDTFPLMFPRMCSPKAKQLPASQTRRSVGGTEYKTIHDISCISRTSRTNLREHLSGSESVLQTGAALHSTFNYPLHSTMNYPLHSTMANADMPSNLEVTLKSSVGQTSHAQSDKKCGSSKDSTCDCTECLEQESDPVPTKKNQPALPPSGAFNDYVAGLEGLAARLLSPGGSDSSQMKRQTGQLHLSKPQSPVELSESTFSNTVLHNSSVEATKGSAPEIDVDAEPSPADLMRERLHIGGLVRTPVSRSRLRSDVPQRPAHQATPYPMYEQTVVQTRVSQRLIAPHPHQHIYEAITPTNTEVIYENLPVRKQVPALMSRRRSTHDKENEAPPALPPRCPTRTPTTSTHSSRPRLPVPACLTEMDSVLSARPGCFNLLKSSVKKRKRSSQGHTEVTAYDLEKRRRLAAKMKVFQRSLSNVNVNEGEMQVQTLGHL